MAAEQWKTIPNLDNKYEVSDHGRVRNKNSGRFMTPRYKDGCCIYRMEKPSTHGRERKSNSGAVLVWSAFVGEIPDGYYVQYKDGNRRNLSLENLYLKSNSNFRKEEYKEGRLGFQLAKSELDNWIFGSCTENEAERKAQL